MLIWSERVGVRLRSGGTATRTGRAPPCCRRSSRGTPPTLLRGFNKPDLVPGHPDLELNLPSRDDTADALLKWAGEWGRDWVVVDTHPGATEVVNGVLLIAHVVVTPVPLRSSDRTEHMVRELADYPVVLIPNFVPPVAPAAEVRRLGRTIHGAHPIRHSGPLSHPDAIIRTRQRLRRCNHGQHPSQEGSGLVSPHHVIVDDDRRASCQETRIPS